MTYYGSSQPVAEFLSSGLFNALLLKTISVCPPDTLVSHAELFRISKRRLHRTVAPEANKEWNGEYLLPAPFLPLPFPFPPSPSFLPSPRSLPPFPSPSSPYPPLPLDTLTCTPPFPLEVGPLKFS